MRARMRAHTMCLLVQPKGKTRCVLAAATDAPACSCRGNWRTKKSAQTLTQRRAAEGTPIRRFVMIQISSLQGRGRRDDGLENLLYSRALCLIPATCLHLRLEPGVLRPYWHVLQRGGRRAPTHHTVTSCLYFTLGVKVLSSHLPAPDAPNCANDVLRSRLTGLQLKRSGANVARAFLQ